MKMLKCMAALLLISSPLLHPQTNSSSNNDRISAVSIWKPTSEIMQKIYTDCGAQQGDKMYECLLNEMAAAGASRSAIEFSALIKGHGYMNGFKKLGEIGAANVYYVFRQNNHEGCILVNCKPDLLDVDNLDYLNTGDMEQNLIYQSLKNSYPQIGIFPGNREGTDYPQKQNLQHHGERIIINYDLRNGCDNCQLLGFAYFAFDFDSIGNFLGTKFVSVKNSLDLQSANAVAENNQNIFSDPSVPIEVSLGEKFAIVLLSNHSAGLKWELGEPLDKKMLILLGTNFVQPYETLPNAAGKETWTFEALGSGSTTLKFNYVHSWGSNSKALEKYNFHVNVK